MYILLEHNLSFTFLLPDPLPEPTSFEYTPDETGSSYHSDEFLCPSQGCRVSLVPSAAHLFSGSHNSLVHTPGKHTHTHICLRPRVVLFRSKASSASIKCEQPRLRRHTTH
ncbi:hypothetical protein DPEC_G00087840 [Dallia pectoralis]|uniref:Uncharacterized protein n=1 Tax=Dallia pectoralis TaxID=75939 RepID=A0ACC2H0J6_DALPE|nr:hypothetical protein DPEC_G00087840 [Dallia pectoralis]